MAEIKACEPFWVSPEDGEIVSITPTREGVHVTVQDGPKATEFLISHDGKTISRDGHMVH